MDYWRDMLDKLSAAYAPQYVPMFYVLTGSGGDPLTRWLTHGQISRADVITFIGDSGKFAYVMKNRYGLTGKMPLVVPWTAFSTLDEGRACAFGPSKFKRAYLDWCLRARLVAAVSPAVITSASKIAVADFEEV